MPDPESSPVVTTVAIRQRTPQWAAGQREAVEIVRRLRQNAAAMIADDELAAMLVLKSVTMVVSSIFEAMPLDDTQLVVAMLRRQNPEWFE